MMLENLTYEEFKGHSVKIKNRLKKELIATGNFVPKRIKVYCKKGSSKLDHSLGIINKMSKEAMIKEIFDPWFLAASQNIRCEVKDVRVEFTGGYNPRIYFYGYRLENKKETDARLKLAVEQHFRKIHRRFQARLKKEKEAKKKETERKRKEIIKRKAAIKQAQKIIETLGEDVYEVFDEIINKKS